MVGPSGSGKSDLALRLIARGFDLVADDQVNIRDNMVSCSAELAGLLEARGLGIVRLPYRATAHLALIVELGPRSLGPLNERMPEPQIHPLLGCPVVRIDAAAPSAPERVALALDCALGLVTQVAGAFAA